MTSRSSSWGRALGRRTTLASRLGGTGELDGVVGRYLDEMPRPLLRAHWPLSYTDTAADDGHTGPIGDSRGVTSR